MKNIKVDNILYLLNYYDESKLVNTFFSLQSDYKNKFFRFITFKQDFVFRSCWDFDLNLYVVFSDTAFFNDLPIKYFEKTYNSFHNTFFSRLLDVTVDGDQLNRVYFVGYGNAGAFAEYVVYQLYPEITFNTKLFSFSINPPKHFGFIESRIFKHLPHARLLQKADNIEDFTKKYYKI